MTDNPDNPDNPDILDELDYLEELERSVRVKYRSHPNPLPKPGRRLSHSEMRSQISDREQDPCVRLSFVPTSSEADMRRAQTRQGLAEELVPATEVFNPTIASLGNAKNHVSNHEKEWILTYLGAFYYDQLITDVLRRVKGGKEATVYCCRAASHIGVDLIAGKVYHEQKFRSLKNDSLYREGRLVLDDQGKLIRGKREARAMLNKTRFGQELRHVNWLTSEYGALQMLHAAGADVPRPIAQSDNAILMEYIGDERWPAPILRQVKLSPGEARPLFDRIMRNIELMLAHDTIHADLSAHNILYWEGKITIIDFPQAVNPYVNPHAYTLLQRDVERVCQHFARFGVQADPVHLTAEIWARQIPS